MKMRISKKQIIAGVAVLMSLVALAGCGDTGKVSSEVQPVSTPKGGVLILPGGKPVK